MVKMFHDVQQSDNQNLTQEYLMEILDYDIFSGVFKWKKLSKNHSEKIGLEAGCVGDSRGKKYRVIRINKISYKAHRLAWLHVYGYLPLMIDHINGDSLDNRIENLRAATYLTNNQNHAMKIKENNLPAGVSHAENNKFRARITVNKNVIFLGIFDSAEKAGEAYLSARLDRHDAPCLEGFKGVS